MVEETNASGAVTRAEIYAGARHLATWNPTGGGSTFFNYADQLGTERLRTFGSGSKLGQPCETITSLPFGDGEATQSLNGGCGDPSPNHFTGKERDTESDLDYFGARYNSSNIGRFMTADWSAKAEPVPYAKLDNPQSLNLYTYVLNNPTTATDPDGHICIFGIGNTCASNQPPPPPLPPPPPPMAFLRTSIKGGYTFLQWTDKKGGYHEDRVPSLVKAVRASKPGAGGPFHSYVVGQVKGLSSPAYGPKGAQINVGDARGRWIHGGGSSLRKHAFDPHQKLTPTLGCTRACNANVERLGDEITVFQQQNPGTPIPYWRTEQ